jgi:ubiquinone/menaquinone biosynthesis C-methylase UbiE
MRASRSVSGLVLASALLFGCSGITKLDYGNLLNRGGWQRPDDVIEVLSITPGASVADIGAGEGYFLPYLSRAVGPEGRVYAVEVEDEPLAALEALVSEQGLGNVEILCGRYEDPLLPDRKIDLVLIVNTYHHIEARPDYFRRLRDDLAEGGRVAVLDPNEELTGIFSLFLDEGHTSRVGDVRKEMEEAGYQRLESHDFLLAQVFEVFGPEGR